MAIANFPSALQPIIQTGYLERRFETALRAKLGFRAIAERREFAARVGQTITDTRPGLLPASTAPLNPQLNTNFDNGLTASQWAVEQYTVGIDRYGQTLDLNVVEDKVGIASRFVQNAVALGESSARSLDMLARDALYGVYLGGNTVVAATLGSAGASVAVDNILGFVPGLVTVGADAYTLVGTLADAVNSSTIPGGKSGMLVFSGNVSVADATAGQPVVAATAPTVLRPNGRLSAAELVTGDTLQMVDNVLGAASIMRDNAVPDIDGFYHAYLDNMTLQGLFKDEDFKLLYRGAYGSAEYKQGTVMEVMGVRFIPTNMAPQQTLGGKRIRRTIVCGAGALVEADFAGQDAADAGEGPVIRSEHDGITMLTRQPMDRFGEIVAQSWKWIGGFCVPTDVTANSTTIPTASNSAYKRAVVIESL